MNLKPDSDASLYIRFFARCSLVLGVLSFSWTAYICVRYEVNLQAATPRLVLTAGMIIGGLTILWVTHKPQRGRNTLRDKIRDVLIRLDGFMLFLSIPALVLLAFILAPAIFDLPNYSIDDITMPVVVRVDSIELQHVPPESVANDPVWNEFYYVPELYEDFWVACGKVTIEQRDGHAIAPISTPARFTSKLNINNKGSSKHPKYYIAHYKMNAQMDSDRFRVGNRYQAWVLRDHPEVVFFDRPMDEMRRRIVTLAYIFSSILVYLCIRIAIGRKLRDKHWEEFKAIFAKTDAAARRNVAK